MRTTATVKISRDLQTVFEFAIYNVADWSKIVVSDEVISEGPVGVGTTFRTITEDRGRQMQLEGEVTRHNPPAEHSVVMIGKQFDLQVDYTFRDLGGDTEVTQVSVVTPKGGMKVFFFLFGWMMKRAGCNAAQEELENLKRLLERPADAQ